MNAVECRALIKDYKGHSGPVRAVDGIDLDIPRGRLVGFLGPNGAGKTTLMRMLYAAFPPTQGTLRVLDHDVATDATALKARIGVVPQENNLDPDFNVRKNLLVYGRYFELPKALIARRADELLEFVGLAEKAKEHIEALSGGMKRRLLLARGLLNDPELLILDEPTTGLDPQARHLVWNKIRELRRRGLTVLLTTHYMDEAERLCDELIVIDHGRVLERGTPAELVQRHITREVLELEFADDAKTLETRLRETPSLRDARIEFVGERALCYVDDAEAAQKEAKPKLAPQSSLVRRSTLEDVFLKLTGRALRE